MLSFNPASYSLTFLLGWIQAVVRHRPTALIPTLSQREKDCGLTWRRCCGPVPIDLSGFTGCTSGFVIDGLKK